MKVQHYFFFIFSLTYSTFFAQEIKQTIRGIVIDRFTEQPLPDVHISLLIKDSIIQQTISNQYGKYRFEQVPIGTYNISFSHIAYRSYTIPEVAVYSKKECIVNASLSYKSYELETTEIVAPQKEKGIVNNHMATVSAYSIRVEDARKLAGGLDDPIRAAGTLPGITSDAAFSENFISIRGNSPRGLKYQMNGVEIPNPSHFARIGSSGGTFTIFSMQMLANSDFFSGAFPAEYGNALAGIFDVKFRTGNSEKKEYTIQLGTLGLDFSAEGSINKKKRSTFLFNYRYAVVGMARFIGYPTEPTYQDLSFHLNFPIKKGGNISVFSIAGKSDRAKIAYLDSNKWERDIDRYNLSLKSDMATLGINYNQLIGEKSVANLIVMTSITDQLDNKKYITDNYSELTRKINQYTSIPLSFAGSFKHKFNNKHSNKTGFSIRKTQHDWIAKSYNFTTNRLDTIVSGHGHSFTTKLYTQSKFDFAKKWSLNIGLFAMHYDVNNQAVVEPRSGIIYQINAKNQLAFAYGKHSQIENYAIYQTQVTDSLGNVFYPNKNLHFAKAEHYILSYKTKLIKNHLFKLEAYYQDLYQIPTEPNGSFSTVNIGELDDIRILENKGTGRNYGIDIGLERYTEDGLYYIINSSVFKSEYKGGDGVVRSTEYDYGFNFKFLAGKNYMIGEKNGRKNYLGWNTNFSVVGGSPYTPLDMNQSRIQQETVLDESKAFTQRENNLIFVDATISYKINKSHRTNIWTLQIKNLFSNGNAIYREYDAVLDKAVTIPSSSFFPNLSYKVQF